MSSQQNTAQQDLTDPGCTRSPARYFDSRAVSGALFFSEDVLALSRSSLQLSSSSSCSSPPRRCQRQAPKLLGASPQVSPALLCFSSSSDSLPSPTNGACFVLLTWHWCRQILKLRPFPSLASCPPQQATNTPCPKPPTPPTSFYRPLSP